MATDQPEVTIVSGLRVLVAIVMPLMLFGCGAMVVGGAAGGGYYVGQDERSAKQIGADARITAAVNTRFVRDADISALDINVDTRNGIVTLNGYVPDIDSLQRAVRLTRGVEGVKRVISRLKVR